MQKPQTIQIFLPTGSPTGIKEAEVTSRLVKAIYFPRTAFEEAGKREMCQFTGVYYLLGEDEEGNSKVYVGEGENCWERLKQHQRKKEFWTEGIIVVSKTNDYNKADVKYLEHHSLNVIEKAGRFLPENNKASLLPSVSEPREADLLDHFETIKILVGTLGFSLFKRPRGEQKIPTKEKFFCQGRGVKSEAILTDEGVLVLEGSYASLTTVPSLSKGVIEYRKRLEDQGVLTKKDNVFVFSKDALFRSPSTAAKVVLGKSVNGWIVWKSKEGKTMDELKRR